MIIYAFDGKEMNQRNLVAAEEAVSGRTYFCPYCGISMRICKSINRRPFFRVLPNTQHLSKACSQIDADELVIRDVDRLDPEAFIQHLMKITLKGEYTEAATRPVQKTAAEEAFTHELSPATLAQIYGAGIDKLDPNTPVKGGKKISDLLITYSHFHTALEGNPVLGRRALEMRPDFAQSGRIRFVCFWTRKKGEKMRRYFYLVVKDPILYQKAAMSLFEIEGPFRECDRYTKSKYKLAAVAAQWEELTEAECHRQCRMCQISNKYHCLGAMEGELYNMRQIYGLEVSLY